MKVLRGTVRDWSKRPAPGLVILFEVKPEIVKQRTGSWIPRWRHSQPSPFADLKEVIGWVWTEDDGEYAFTFDDDDDGWHRVVVHLIY